ncbi:hypothetical protein JCM5353_007233 [Sporobolomyces roseus]
MASVNTPANPPSSSSSGFASDDDDSFHDIQDGILDRLTHPADGLHLSPFEMQITRELAEGEEEEGLNEEENEMGYAEGNRLPSTTDSVSLVAQKLSQLSTSPFPSKPTRQQYAAGKAVGRSILSSIHKQYHSDAKKIATSVDFPSSPKPISLEKAPPLLPESLRAPPNLPNLHAPLGGGGIGDDDDDDDETETDSSGDSDYIPPPSGSTETCPAGEDNANALVIGRNIDEIHNLIATPDHKTYHAHYTPSSPSPVISPTPLAYFDSTKLVTSFGILSSTTIEHHRGTLFTTTVSYTNLSIHLYSSNFVSTVLEQCQGQTVTYNLITDSTTISGQAPGHLTTEENNFYLFSEGTGPLIAVEMRGKERTGKTGGRVHLFLHFDKKKVGKESIRSQFDKAGIDEGVKTRGVPPEMPDGKVAHVQKWMATHSPSIQLSLKPYILENGRSLNPLTNSTPFTPVLASDTIISSTICPPHSSLVSPVRADFSARFPSKHQIFEELHFPLIMQEFLGKKLGFNRLLRGGIIIKENDGTSSQVESGIILATSLDLLKETVHQATGGLIKASDIGQQKVSMDKGVASALRQYHHKSSGAAIVALVQQSARDEPELAGRRIFSLMYTYSNNGSLQAKYAEHIQLPLQYDQLYIVTGDGYVQVRYGAFVLWDSRLRIEARELSERRRKDRDRKEGGWETRSFVEKLRKMQGSGLEVPVNVKPGTVRFTLPLTKALQIRLRYHETSLSLRLKVISDGTTLSFGRKLQMHIDSTPSIKVFSDGNDYFVEANGEREPLNESSLTKTSNLKYDYWRWSVEKAKLDARLPRAVTNLDPATIGESLQSSYAAYQFEALDVKQSIEDTLNDPRQSYCFTVGMHSAGGYPVVLVDGKKLEPFKNRPAGLPSVTSFDLDSTFKWNSLGWPDLVNKGLNATAPPPTTLYWLHRLPGDEQTVWVSGEVEGRIVGPIHGSDVLQEKKMAASLIAVKKAEALKEQKFLSETA